jgi:hypothetical protein
MQQRQQRAGVHDRIHPLAFLPCDLGMLLA